MAEMNDAPRTLPARLYSGSHEPDGEMCVMEAVAWMAGEPWTDHPACACPVITAFAITINDRLGDEFRQRLLPYVPRLIGTRSTPEVERRRAFRAADWAVRRFAPAALLAAGYESQARTLQELAPIVDVDTARAAAARAVRAAAEAAEAWAVRAAAEAWAAEAAVRAAAEAAEAAVRAAAEASEAWAAWAAARAVRAADLSLACLDDLLSITEAAPSDG